MKKTIYIIIEIVRRELDSKIILAIKAKENNFDIALTKKSRLFSVLKYLKSGIIFLKSFGPRYDFILNDVKKYGHQLVGMDEEGVQINYDEHLVGKLRFSKYVFKNLKFLFAWGINSKKIYSNFAKKNKLDSKKIISTGSPRIDILKKRYNKIYEIEPKNFEYKNFILIATQFLKYNQSDDTYFNFNKAKFMNFIIKEHKKNSFSSKGKNFKDELNEFARSFAYQKKSFVEYDKMYKFLSKNFPNEVFVIKPHPVEGLNYYKGLSQKLPNIKVITDNSNINSWILRSKLLISCNCTTTIEARLLGKPNINFIPYKDIKAEYSLSKLTSLNVRNIKSLISIIRDKKYEKFKIQKREVAKILYDLENFGTKYGVDSIINSLMKIKIEYKNLKNINLKFFFKFYLITKARFHSLVGIFDYHRYRNQKSKRDKFNINYLNNRLDTIQMTLFGKKKYIFKENFYGIFYLEKI